MKPINSLPTAFRRRLVLATIAMIATALVLFLVGRSGSATAGLAPASTQPVAAPDGWTAAWSDEFDGDAVDRKKWDFDKGTFLPTGPNAWQPGWGNGELQYYSARPENVFVRDGMLHIIALRQPYKGAQFSSARLTTRNLSPKKYGRFEFRAKLPTGKGIWPAIWMRPQDDKYGGWAASGEIDIMEARGQEPTKVLGTLHYGSGWPANVHTGKDFVFPNNGTIADFHVYALEWEPGEIRWYVDEHLYQTQSFWWSCSDRDGPKGVEPADASELNPWPAPFDQPFYITLNLAVGGQFLGNPDKTTPFPAEMIVDYVRVYDKASGYGQSKPRGPGPLPFLKP